MPKPTIIESMKAGIKLDIAPPPAAGTDAWRPMLGDSCQAGGGMTLLPLYRMTVCAMSCPSTLLPDTRSSLGS